MKCTNIQPKIGFVAIARPTFDVRFATSLTTRLRDHLAQVGFSCCGPNDLIMDDKTIRAATKYFSECPVDMLLVLQATFADSTMVCQLAQAIRVPLMLWALPEESTGGRLRLNSFCGINLAGHSLRKLGLRYNYIYAEPADKNAIARLKAFATAANIINRLKSARIGRVGENPEGFETCEVNTTMLGVRLGLRVIQIKLNDVFDAAREIDPQRIWAIEKRVRSQLSGLDSVDANALRGTLSTFVALDDLASNQQLGGIAIRCWPEFFTELGCAACGAMSMLSDMYIPCSCETDVNGTITQLILQWISGEPAFSSDIVSLDTADDSAVLWHCGLAPLSMADPDHTPQATQHSNLQKPLLMHFPLKPGRVTLARLSEGGNELRLAVGGGEMLKREAAFSGTSGTIRFDSGAQAVMDSILGEGIEHHISLTYGDHQDTLLALADMLDIPVLRI